MMALSSRMSRRPAVMGVAAVVTLIVLVLAAKDQSDKLTVMTAANQDYQRMTDSQAERIRRVQQQLENEKDKVKELEKKHRATEADQREKAEREIKSGEKQMNSLRSEANHIQQEYDALKREYEELSQNSIKVSHQVSRLEAQNSQLSSEVERMRQDSQKAARSLKEGTRCHDQYQALFKEHQQAMDKIQGLQRDKDRLQAQVNNNRNQQQQQHQNYASTSSRKASSSSPKQIKLPAHSSSTGKPILPPVQQAAHLEQPFLPNNRISSTSQTPAAIGGQHGGAAPPPVAPAPIVAAASDSNNSPHQYLQPHQVGREDVMEAPSFFGDHQQVVHRGHQEDFGQFFHHPGQYALGQQQQKQHQPIDRPSVQNQYYQAEALPYHQAPQQQQQHNSNNNIHVRQLSRSQPGSHALHFQRRSSDQQQQQQPNIILANQDHFHYPQNYDAREAEEDDNEYVEGAGDDDGQDGEEEDEDGFGSYRGHAHAYKAGVLQPLNPIQQPEFALGNVNNNYLRDDRRKEVDRVFRRYQL